MNLSFRSTTSRLARVTRITVLAVAATVGAVAIVNVPSAAAEAPQLAAWLPDRVSHYAEQAVESLEQYESSGDLDTLRTYERQRAYAAIYTAQHLGYSPQEMVRAWSTTPIDYQRAILGALTQLGVPYRYGSSSEGVGFDCSGLTSFAWRTAGHELARNSSSQISAATGVNRTEAKAGDLVQYPGHIMLYLGIGDAIVHSIQTGRDVELDHITSRRSGRFGDPIG